MLFNFFEILNKELFIIIFFNKLILLFELIVIFLNIYFDL